MFLFQKCHFKTVVVRRVVKIKKLSRFERLAVMTTFCWNNDITKIKTTCFFFLKAKHTEIDGANCLRGYDQKKSNLKKRT